MKNNRVTINKNHKDKKLFSFDLMDSKKNIIKQVIVSCGSPKEAKILAKEVLEYNLRIKNLRKIKVTEIKEKD